jgi:hypothetical protein
MDREVSDKGKRMQKAKIGSFFGLKNKQVNCLFNNRNTGLNAYNYESIDNLDTIGQFNLMNINQQELLANPNSRVTGNNTVLGRRSYIVKQ